MQTMFFSKIVAVNLLLCISSLMQEVSSYRNREKRQEKAGLEQKKLSGRWYLYMDNRSAAIRDNTYGDFETMSDGRLINTIYRYFPDLEECRITSLMFTPITSDNFRKEAMMFEVTRMSTNENLGTQTVLFIDDHPTEGFAIMHQKTHMDTYLVTTRARDPSKQRVAIEIALTELSLDLKDMRVKSASYGCEWKQERGIEL
uniref:Uncharacterized protein LOC111118395 n=1 Tax=Crassostrea virginica TaxID=6565 RepID=A0A8B8CG89_CRAVI|nr:uncharacterized protein LOC111118395 [Crassostrea virginica]